MFVFRVFILGGFGAVYRFMGIHNLLSSCSKSSPPKNSCTTMPPGKSGYPRIHIDIFVPMRVNVLFFCEVKSTDLKIKEKFQTATKNSSREKKPWENKPQNVNNWYQLQNRLRFFSFRKRQHIKMMLKGKGQGGGNIPMTLRLDGDEVFSWLMAVIDSWTN